jgi:hypothetical protein
MANRLHNAKGGSGNATSGPGKGGTKGGKLRMHTVKGPKLPGKTSNVTAPTSSFPKVKTHAIEEGI